MIFDGGSHGPGMCSARTGKIDMGHTRLNRCCVKLLDRLADKPTASIPYFCNGWAGTQAASGYWHSKRLAGKIFCRTISSVHSSACECRPVVLCIQDTIELDFNGQQTHGLGTLGFPAQRGMYLQSAYAVSPVREPLGVLNAWM